MPNSSRLVKLVSLVALAAGAVLLLRPGPAHAAFPGVNGRIVYAGPYFDGASESWQLVTLDHRTGQTAQVTADLALKADPAWSADGSKIAFTWSASDLSDHEVFVIDADGTGQTNLTNSPATQDEQPAWSPDGAQITFKRDSDIYLMNADGSGVLQLTSGTSMLDGDPAWSPDGARIAFRRDGDIYVMNADGSGQTNLTSSAAYDAAPDWSPDGTRLVFTSAPVNEDSDLYTMNADGSGLVQLTNNQGPPLSAADEGAPVWSPDGRRVLYLTSDGLKTLMLTGGMVQTLGTTNQLSGYDWQALADTDGDGCADEQEVGLNPARGGMRDATNFWDVLDVPMGTMTGRDATVSGGDIAAIAQRMGATDEGPGDFDRDSDPLSTPNPLGSPSGARTNYHPAFDRGGTVPGGDPWDLLPPDGAIAGGDIAAAVVQFGHSCM